MKNRYLNNALYIKSVRWWLTAILLFLPFQNISVKSLEVLNKTLSTYINRLDEATMIFFFPLAIIELYRNRELKSVFYIILFVPILALCISGVVSGIVNGNPLIVTALGTIDYIKVFLFIFIYAAFFRDFRDFRRVFHLLLIIAVFLGIVAFIQEIWALTMNYILEKDIYDKGNYFLGDIPLLVYRKVIQDHWRFGIFRAPSLLRNPNALGFYLLFILTIYLSLKKKKNLAVIAALLSGVLVSVSRMVYSGFVFLLGVHILKRKKWIGVLAILVMVVFLIFTDVSIKELSNKADNLKGRNVITFREYVVDKAIEIWKGHPFWGRGPGMFGGVISVIYQSPVYDEYNFPPKVIAFIKHLRAIDQFWPQVLVEMGVIGTAIMAGIFISLVIVIIIAKQRAKSEELKGLFTGLLTFIIVILIYSVGGGINSITAFTYYAFIGMGIGCVGKK